VDKNTGSQDPRTETIETLAPAIAIPRHPGRIPNTGIILTRNYTIHVATLHNPERKENGNNLKLIAVKRPIE
jgi:hypothetical protein